MINKNIILTVSPRTYQKINTFIEEVLGNKLNLIRGGVRYYTEKVVLDAVEHHRIGDDLPRKSVLEGNYAEYNIKALHVLSTGMGEYVGHIKIGNLREDNSKVGEGFSEEDYKEGLLEVMEYIITLNEEHGERLKLDMEEERKVNQAYLDIRETLYKQNYTE